MWIYKEFGDSQVSESKTGAHNLVRENRVVGRPPAHRDKTAMNGAQILMAHSDDDRATCLKPVI